MVTLTALFSARTMQEALHAVKKEVSVGQGLFRETWLHPSMEEGNVMTNEC